jgi:hypothetical protein
MIINPTTIVEPKITFRDELLQGLCTLKSLSFDVVQCTPQMLINPHLDLVAKLFCLLEVVY